MILTSRLAVLLIALAGFYFIHINITNIINITNLWTISFKQVVMAIFVITISAQIYLVIRRAEKLTPNILAYLDESSDETTFFENVWYEVLNLPECLILYEAKLNIFFIILPIILTSFIFSTSLISIIHSILGVMVGVLLELIGMWFFYERMIMPLLQKTASDEPSLFHIPIEPTKVSIRTRLTIIFTSIVTIPIFILSSFFYRTIEKVNSYSRYPIEIEVVQHFIDNAIIVAVITFIGAIIFARLLALSISRPIHLMMPQIEKITMGDLRGSISVISRNENGELAVAFNQLIQSIRFLVEEIQNAGAMIVGSSFHILTISQEQKSDAADQAASLAEFQSTTEELSHSLRQIVDQAQTGQELATETLQEALKGQDLIENNVEAFRRIREQSRASIEKVQHFVSQSNQITQIFEAIQTIVAQTKMIALNASIEAADSGSTSRRFSVIAAQIRNLSDQSTALLSQVSRMVNVLQTSTMDMAHSIELEIQTIEDGVSHAEKIQTVFDEILQMTENNATSVREISSVASQQAAAQEEIVNGIHLISDVANKISDSNNRLNELTVQLDELSRKMSFSVQQFQS